jgi:L-iditol 2-dehydrogenase
MRVAVLQRPGVIGIENQAEPMPGRGDVRIRVAAVGICGSDVHYFKRGRIGRYVVDQPLILGHESSGVIDLVGQGVGAARIGEHVAIEPGIPCRHCQWCKSGRYNLCPYVEFHATPPVHGSLAELVVVPADFAHPIPDSLSLQEAALVEPTAVAVHACRRAGLAPGDTCAILGAGPVGLLILQVALAFGAQAPFVLDPVSARTELARSLGASTSAPPEDGVDVVFDASGNAQALAQTIQLARRGGRVVWIGLPSAETVPLSVASAIDKELDVRGVFRYANAHPLAIRLLAGGQVRAAPLISHRFPLEKSAEALEMVASNVSNVVKVIIEPSTRNSASTV